ncbi:MAG: PLP-dependent aspartate aminotransferase family protein, partial [Anaerolineae bacterium]|nr:PLP-dependent aspartate aminotransferase family protein [Anaerolineae bacterium]
MTTGQGPSTRSVHAGVERHKPGHSLTTPIIQSATYTFQNTDDLTSFMHAKIWTGATNGREEYGRYGNPTVHAVEQKLAQLDGGEDALLYSSGMAAVTSILLSSLPTDTHIIMTDDCYRRTRQFCNTFLKRLGIETTVVSMGDYDAIEQAVDPKRTRFLISESPTNPYLRVADFERLAAIGKKYRIRTLIDSTFGTPINQQPYSYGIDYIVHSGTKYLGGHHDILAGVVIGSRERIAALRDAQGVLGALVAPQTAFLLERGLRTLALRVERQNQ